MLEVAVFDGAEEQFADLTDPNPLLFEGLEVEQNGLSEALPDDGLAGLLALLALCLEESGNGVVRQAEPMNLIQPVGDLARRPAVSALFQNLWPERLGDRATRRHAVAFCRGLSESSEPRRQPTGRSGWGRRRRRWGLLPKGEQPPSDVQL